MAKNSRDIAFRSFLRRLSSYKEQPIFPIYQIKLTFYVKEWIAIVKRNTSYLGWKSNIALEAPDANYLLKDES